MVKRILAGLLSLVFIAGLCTGGNTMRTEAAEYADTSAYESLAEAYSEDFRIGVAVQAIDHWNDPTAEIGNEAKEDLIRRFFSSMTFGNELKPAYNFDPSSPTLFRADPAAEELLIWARDNKMPVRGHVLVWHSQVNPAIFAKNFQPLSGGKVSYSDQAELDEDCLVDRETLIERLRTYIYGVLEYTYAKGFADVIYAWDVVNEAADEGQEDGLRRSLWYRIIGPEYLYYSFLFAREAELAFSEKYAALYGLDPETDDLSPIRPLLFYNDYNEWYEKRCGAIIRFLTEDVYNAGQSMAESFAIREDGDGTIFGDGLLDGIGMQGHLDDTQNLDQYVRALRRYDEAVHLVHITELDVGETASGSMAEPRQAEFYYDFFKALLQERRNGVNLTSVTFWGLTDDASWRKGANPLLLRGNLEKKPSFDAVLAAAKGEDFSAAVTGPSLSAGSKKIDFEPYKEGGTTVTVPPDSVGFYSRGSGHQSVLVLVHSENHTEGAALGFALRVQRNEQDAAVKQEINSWIGKQLHVQYYVKTADSEIRFGLEGGETKELLRTASDGDWTLLDAVFEVPAEWGSASLYVETDGSADIFIDDVLIEVLCGEDGAADGSTDLKADAMIPELSIPMEELPENDGLAFTGSMKTGWNLGNTMDAFNDSIKDDLSAETAWQKVKTTPELIHAVHEAGFETVRIPVTWHGHLGENDRIHDVWLDRVQEITDMCMEEGMYVILNIHHDNDLSSDALYPDEAHMERSSEFVRHIWEQLAERFADYDEHLIFEAMNEPRLVGHRYEWYIMEGDPDQEEAVRNINALNQLFVDTVRAAGGSNLSRYLMCPGYCACPEGVLTDDFVLPEDPGGFENRIIVSVHAYRPYNFALEPGGTSSFSASKMGDTKDINWFVNQLYKKFIQNGIPVVVGEFGATNRDENLRARVEYAAYFTAYAKAHGIPCIWWDNGSVSGDGENFAIIDRKSCSFVYPEIAEAMRLYS